MKKIAFSLMTLAFGTIVGILLLEIGFRIFYTNPMVNRDSRKKSVWNSKIEEKINKLSAQAEHKQKKFGIAFGLADFDPILGWDNLPGTHIDPRPSYKVTYTINSQKMRADREFPLTPQARDKKDGLCGGFLHFRTRCGGWLGKPAGAKAGRESRNP